MASNESATREAAYYKWLEAGGPAGEDLRFWLEAEREQDEGETSQDVDKASEDSFPASDPPAGSVSTVGSAPRRAVQVAGKP